VEILTHQKWKKIACFVY